MMDTIKKNGYDDAVAALEAALRIIEKMSAQNADAGCCVWTANDGRTITAMLTPEDCAGIRGAVYIGGRCRDVAGKISITPKVNSQHEK